MFASIGVSIPKISSSRKFVIENNLCGHSIEILQNPKMSSQKTEYSACLDTNLKDCP